MELLKVKNALHTCKSKKGLRKGGNKRGFRGLLGRFANYLGKMQLGCKQV